MPKLLRQTSIAILLLGLVAAAVAPVASAAPEVLVTTWPAAQQAAGFSLLRPTETASLHRSGKISVDPCEVTGQLSKRQVGASYGSLRHGSSLGIYETNAPFPCGNGEEVHLLRHLLVHGRRAGLFALCGGSGQPSCTSPNQTFYELDWHERGLTLIATGGHVSSQKVIAFARALRPV